MKVLISAYACEPNKGSEPGVGWNMVHQLAKHHQVWAMVRDEYREDIEAEIAKNPVPGLQFVYCDLPIWARWWNKKEKGVQIYYYLWQICAYFVARKLHQEIDFDVIHHVTYVRYWTPSFISLLPVPFLWGPVGGGESAPKAFWSDFSFRGRVYETLRDLARGVGEQDPFLYQTVKRCALALATTQETATRLQMLKIGQVEMVGESALSVVEIDRLGSLPIPPDSPLRFISMGRLLHWKGFYLGIEAFARANISGAEYWVVGDGPELERLRKLTEKLGVSDRVKFLGRLPREETLDKLGECHVLVHPSLHDSGGWVCLEAMAAGRPVICLDLGGPSTQVVEETGFKVPADGPEQAINDLTKAMMVLAKEPDRLIKMGEAGKKRVRDFYQWNLKGEFFTKIYEQIVGKIDAK